MAEDLPPVAGGRSHYGGVLALRGGAIPADLLSRNRGADNSVHERSARSKRPLWGRCRTGDGGGVGHVFLGRDWDFRRAGGADGLGIFRRALSGGSDLEFRRRRRMRLLRANSGRIGAASIAAA